jgi:ubiquitin C-terminal hydrolase
VPIPSNPAAPGSDGGESPSDSRGAKPSKWRRKLSAAAGRAGRAGQGAGRLQYPKQCSLEACIAAFTADEILEGDNMYTCEKCEKRQRCVRKLSIYKCPEVLVVHIKRFQYTSIVREKLFTDVQFPLQGLDMAPFLGAGRTDPHSEHSAGPGGSGSGSGSTIYDLSGVVHHSGGINGGHYVAHVNSEWQGGGGGGGGGGPESASGQSQSWMCFNDAHVSPISPKHIAGPSAYVLFYKLRK